ncbi:Bestrophin, RFP-TM, chloride channel-domain-containing protein [Crucibulum laeve]|uniref:Bestrophin, RFP-TM, chloride channel-domain-containing protein n=1 Tax=Crucibulum laeve TaxID=68775 RepID=A0A5C3LM48_9AGAR|nr:Bestrophin, RFP-TM, chloride channel-domain-containing protein [Crucibulum laeve]
MVSQNPLFRGRWTAKKFSATVFNDVWPGVLFFTLVATIVCLVSERTRHNLGISNQLLTVLGTVLGLVISFRTSSAYERYQDGRKMWTNISTASRNLAQMIWIHVSNTRDRTDGEPHQVVLQSIVEKKTMINLHLLRGEEGVNYVDLFPLVCCLPRYANTPPAIPTDADKLPLWWTHDEKGAHLRYRENSVDSEKVLLVNELEDTTLKPARNPLTWRTTIYDHIPLLRFIRWCIRQTFRLPSPPEDKRSRGQIAGLVRSHVPLEIWLKLLEPAIATGVTNNLTLLQDTLSNLERICNTPLPFAYQAHLRISLWLYLFFLPFQIYNSFKYISIPGTAFVSFFLIGFLEIGQEIENPFNYDLNDLDLDHFCFAIQRDLHEITTHTNPEPSDFFNAWNKPFAPADQRNAEKLTRLEGKYTRQAEFHVGEPGIDSIRRTLLQGWREIDNHTRSKEYTGLSCHKNANMTAGNVWIALTRKSNYNIPTHDLISTKATPAVESHGGRKKR